MDSAKAEIARQTGLSPQTITIIMRQLEGDGLVLKQSRQRGRIGQPASPLPRRFHTGLGE